MQSSAHIGTAFTMFIFELKIMSLALSLPAAVFVSVCLCLSQLVCVGNGQDRTIEHVSHFQPLQLSAGGKTTQKHVIELYSFGRHTVEM